MPESDHPVKRAADDRATWKAELDAELKSILAWWSEHMPDDRDAGFWGTIQEDNSQVAEAPKGLVMVARILWTYSAAWRYENRDDWKVMADRAFHFLKNRFQDTWNKGFFWAVEVEGKPTENRKQVYGQAFAVYGLSEYYRAFQNEDALQLAKETYHLIEQYALDIEWGGYVEAFTNDWKPIDDLRLSPKDANERKTMNTHLHVVEAYANLYRIWPDETLRNRIVGLLRIFDLHIIDPKTGHLKLFFTDTWQSKSNLVSYGHDIEAAWLLLECAEVIESETLIARFQELCLQLGRAAFEGMDHRDGGLWYEFEPDTHHFILEKHWWPQAEAMVGWWDCYRLSPEETFRKASVGAWKFIRQHMLDPVFGEWHWGVDSLGKPMLGQTKAGLWKCPYHNGRACLEMLARL